MTAVPKLRLTPAEYLARERASDFKSEFFDGEMFAMAGGSRAHSLAAANLARALGNALGDGPCEVHGSDLRVKVEASGLYTYPDVTVACGELAFDDRRKDTLLNPVLLVEVLSPSTEKYDRTTKFKHYQKLPSLREFVLVHQDRPLVERLVRQADDTWTHYMHDGLDAAVAFAAVPATVALAELYRRVEFPQASALRD